MGGKIGEGGARVLYPRPRSARFRSRLRSARSSSTMARWSCSACNFTDLSADSLVMLSWRSDNSLEIPCIVVFKGSVSVRSCILPSNIQLLKPHIAPLYGHGWAETLTAVNCARMVPILSSFFSAKSLSVLNAMIAAPFFPSHSLPWRASPGVASSPSSCVCRRGYHSRAWVANPISAPAMFEISLKES